MSSNDHQRNYSSSILRSRYKDLLKGTIPRQIASDLCNNDLLTKEELQRVLCLKDDTKQHQQLLDILTCKGIPMLTKYSSAIKLSKKTSDAVSTLNGKDSMIEYARRMSPTETKPPDITINQGCQKLPDTASPLGKAHVMKGRRGVFPKTLQTGGGYIAAAKEAHSGEPTMPVKGHPGYDLEGSTSFERDTEQCSDWLTKVEQRSFEMEAFTVLMFTFFSQLRVSIDQQLSATSRSGEAASKQNRESTLALNEAAKKNYLSWLTLDVNLQSLREYFPADFLKGVNPSAEHLVPLRLSVLLDAFQQLCQKYLKLVKDNESLQEKLRLLPEIIKQKSTLEAQLREKEISSLPPSHPPSSSSSICAAKPSETSHTLREKLKRLESLERAYANTEERCKQLVVVTQQWSAECADKDKLIAVQTTQIEQLDAELDKTQRKLAKYKKHWAATKETANTKRVSDAQFEELRLELVCRKELHNQVVAQRDDAEKRTAQLTSEVDELKDLIEELRDRLSNYKVQAQAKEPTVREMSHTIEENRKLKEQLEELQRTCSEQSDKLLAYETYVADLTLQGEKRLQQAPPTLTTSGGATAGKPPPSNQSPASTEPKPKPKRTPSSQQAMVIGGYGIPSHIRREVRNRLPELKKHNQQLHTSNGEDAKGLLSREAGQLDAPPLPLMHRQLSTEPKGHTSEGSDDDNLSVTTMSSSVSSLSQDSLSGHSSPNCKPRGTAAQKSVHQSIFTTKPPPAPAPFAQLSHSAPTTPQSITSSHHYDMPSTSNPPNWQGQGSIRHPPGVYLPPTLQNRASPSAANGGGDYTQRVRYPNNSGIIIKPLTDDERTLDLQTGNDLANREKSAVRVYNEPIAYFPADSALYDFTLNEKQCPVCQHVFVTLTEKEFKSHVALCFK